MKNLLQITFWAAIVGMIASCQPAQENPSSSRLAAKGPQRPADEWLLQRSWPDGQISMRAYAKGLEQARQMALQKGDWPGFDRPWLTAGPSNIGARANAVAIHPSNGNILFAGFSQGGLWRSTDGAVSWQPVFDDQPFLAIGAIAFDPSNPSTIYVGTGDPNISGYPFIGDGIWRSTDGGDNWENIGLGGLNIISKIIVDPQNGQNIYAAAMGVPFERNNERGLYRSRNGGQTWEQVLFISNQAGITDVVMDPSNPNILYASPWNRIRNNQESLVYGPVEGIYKTTNGGDTWTVLQNGLPNEEMGRIGLAIAPSNPNHLYAVYIGTDSQLFDIYESEDAGASWASVQRPDEAVEPLQGGIMGGFGWYFAKIRVNPLDEEDIYILAVDLWRSRDGGINWEGAAPPWWEYDVHADKHDLQWAPDGTPYLATDGGLYSAFDDMQVWLDAENIPTTQFYRVAVNPHRPNFYYGGAQDNGSTGGTPQTMEAWDRIYGGDGFQMAFHPDLEDVLYCETQNGGIVVYDDFDGWQDATQGIDNSDRKNWDMQYFLSPHNPGTMYTGTYRVYRSVNAGIVPFWEPISDDLTDGLVLEPRFHTITTLHESPLVQDLVYVGTTDGNVWTSGGGDFNWQSITQGLPDRSVSSIKASPAFEGGVYVTHSAYKDYDFTPHLYRSMDGGQNWENIASDLPNISINDVYILPNTQDSILFVATDGGVYGSINAGSSWQRLGNNMPIIPVYDLEVDYADEELIAGTYARSIMAYPLDSILRGSPPVSTYEPAWVQPRFRVFPNPGTGPLSLAWQNAVAGNAQLRILNTQGSTLWQQTMYLNAERGRIPLHHLPKLVPGMYWLEIRQGVQRQVVAFVRS